MSEDPTVELKIEVAPDVLLRASIDMLRSDLDVAWSPLPIASATDAKDEEFAEQMRDLIGAVLLGLEEILKLGYTPGGPEDVSRGITADRRASLTSVPNED